MVKLCIAEATYWNFPHKHLGTGVNVVRTFYNKMLSTGSHLRHIVLDVHNYWVFCAAGGAESNVTVVMGDFNKQVDWENWYWTPIEGS